MSEPLTPERRAELRGLLDSTGYDSSAPLRDWMMGHLAGRTHAAMVDAAVNALPALLDAADELDDARAEALAIGRYILTHGLDQGEVWVRVRRCEAHGGQYLDIGLLPTLQES